MQASLKSKKDSIEGLEKELQEVRELKIKDNNRLEFLTKDIDILNATIEKLENEIANLKVNTSVYKLKNKNKFIYEA